MREVAGKYVKHYEIKMSKGGKRMTLCDLCEIKKRKNPDEVLHRMITEINERTNETAGGWLCEK
jgi:Zn-finger protein